MKPVQDVPRSPPRCIPVLWELALYSRLQCPHSKSCLLLSPGPCSTSNMTKDASPKSYVEIGAGISRKKGDSVCSRQQGNRICHAIPDDAILRAQDRLKEVELLISLEKGTGRGWHLSQTRVRGAADSPGKPKHAFPFCKEKQPNWDSALAQSPSAKYLPQSALTAVGHVGRRTLSVRAYSNRIKFLKPLPNLFTTNSDR